MKKIGKEVTQWEKSDRQVFWGEIAPCDHLVQIYENDAVFLQTLEGFASDGFLKGESVIIIATAQHLVLLNDRLKAQGFDLEALMGTGQYITEDAEDCLPNFMVDDWPDEQLFTSYVSALLNRAQKHNRKVRAFGEIVAVLWTQGHCGATVKLEDLWHRFQQKNLFCLYCAYPKSGFTQDAKTSINNICQSHSKIIDGRSRRSSQIFYNTIS